MLESFTSNREHNPRRNEIQRQIVSHGFQAGRSYLPSAAQHDPEALVGLLEELGPVFGSFGRYVSTRPDMLALQDCLTLAKIKDRASPTPQEDVRRIVSKVVNTELTTDGSPSFVKFNPEPFECRLLFQLHHGELSGGDAVVIKVVHPDLQIEQELHFLLMIGHLFESILSHRSAYSQLVEDYRDWVLRETDCMRTMECLEVVGNGCRENRSLCVPKVFVELCSSVVLVTERLAGVRLDKYLEANANSPTAPLRNAVAPHEIARLICDVWLGQTFDARMMPVDMRAENILIRSPTQIALLDGGYSRLPVGASQNLLAYLVAVATEEPGKALTALLQESDGPTPCEPTLDRQFRQIVPFRDGGWNDNGESNCLAETLFSQWRLVAQAGYSPLRHMVHFYVATFSIVATARRLSPNHDSLLEGIGDLRMSRLMRDLSASFEPSYWAGRTDLLASLVILGPQHLDEALRKAVRPTIDTQLRSGSGSSRHSMILAAVIALACLYGFTNSLGTDSAEQFAAFLFLLIGGLTLFQINKR